MTIGENETSLINRYEIYPRGRGGAEDAKDRTRRKESRDFKSVREHRSSVMVKTSKEIPKMWSSRGRGVMQSSPCLLFAFMCWSERGALPRASTKLFKITRSNILRM